MSDTSIRVSDELADELYSRKERGDTYEDVIWRLIEQAEGDTDDEDSNPSEGPENPTGAESQDWREPNTDGLREEMERVLEESDVPGRASAVEETRREAIRWGWDYLREHGPLSPTELADAIFEEFEADPDLNYSRSEERHPGYQFWDNCGRSVLRDLPGVVDGGDGWRINETGAGGGEDD